ncbi:hypothetical protein BJX99DRAFT_225299 [Aspergillus californicus]
MSLPPTTQFINDLLLELSHYLTSRKPLEEKEENESESENEARSHHRQTQSQPTSAFPAAQLPQLKPLMLTLHCLFPNEFLLALDILDRGLVKRVNVGDKEQMEGQDEEENEDQIETEGRNLNIDAHASTPEEDFFFVTSASTIPSAPSVSSPFQRQTETYRYQNRWQEKGYEVRLQAWNCTCPAFTIAAFRGLGPEPELDMSSPEPSSSSLSEARTEDEDGKDNSNEAMEGVQNHGLADEIDVDAHAADDSSTSAYSFGGTLPLHPESAPAVCKHILACLLAALCPGLGPRGLDGGDGGEGRFITLAQEEVAALCAGWGG